ncbi:YtxH domain-containing protein [Fibrella aquatica]|uniref:YtxH domain-containing protein n=1 Tax=Fibrella aquatica TaxID=3242487 RepID=UPI003522E6FE
MFFETKKYPQDYLTDKMYLAGVVTGLLGGLAIGLLFAPRSGKDTREQIADSVSDKADKAKDRWNKVKSQAKDSYDDLKSNVSHVADEAQDKAEQLADDAKSGLDNLKGNSRFF